MILAVAAFLITMHAYRSWSEDNPRGYVQRGQPGIQPLRPRLARHRALIAMHEQTRFNRRQMSLAIETAREVCSKLGTTILAASCTATHLHVLVELSTARQGGACPSVQSPITPDALCARIKSIVGWKHSQQLGTTGNRWFSRGKDISPVKDARHEKYLMDEYLPRHELKEGGVFRRWK